MAPSGHGTVLIIMRGGRRRSHLSACLRALGTAPIEVDDCRQAQHVLAQDGPLKLVISDVDLHDGNWRDTLAASVRRPGGVSFLVSTPLADYGLWSEVLWRGAHDLLVEPYSASEVGRIVESALRAQDPEASTPRQIATIAQAV